MPPASRPVLVLVHGAWHGGWCWSRVLRALRAAGCEAQAPTLTGLGERAHLLSPAVDLALHVRDVAAVLEAEDLRGVVLVGHSYAGMLLDGVAALAPGRVARLVYLDALVPRRGDAALDLFSPPVREAVLAAAQAGDGWRVAPPLRAADFGVLDPADRAWVDGRLTAQALATFTQPAAAPPAELERSYIVCTAPRRATYEPFAAAARSSPDWDYLELAAGHDAMVTEPAELARLLLAQTR